MLHWARRRGIASIAIEDLEFADSKTRELHGRRKQFRRLISRFPTARLRSRLISMAAEAGIAIVAVDPAYTSCWGGEHWQKPTSTTTMKTTRHEAAAIVIGRRAQGYRARRRTPPPACHRSDGMRHRSAQAGPDGSAREGSRQPRPRVRTRSACLPGP
jgi:IS605 OrfB family transposase